MGESGVELPISKRSVQAELRLTSPSLFRASFSERCLADLTLSKSPVNLSSVALALDASSLAFASSALLRPTSALSDSIILSRSVNNSSRSALTGRIRLALRARCDGVTGMDGESGTLDRAGVAATSSMPDFDVRLSMGSGEGGGARPFLFFFLLVDGAETLGGR